MSDTTAHEPSRLADPFLRALADLWAFLPVPPAVPVTGGGIVTALRNAEAAACGERRELWGFAAMNAQAALNAGPGARPSAAELWAVALEYARIAAAG
jgi:hypothetical protein